MAKRVAKPRKDLSAEKAYALAAENLMPAPATSEALPAEVEPVAPAETAQTEPEIAEISTPVEVAAPVEEVAPVEPVADVEPLPARKPRVIKAKAPAPVAKKPAPVPKLRKPAKVAKPAGKAPKPVARKGKLATVPKKPAKTGAKTIAFPKIPLISQLKDTIMATTKTTDFTAMFSGVVTEAQEKAKAAFEKSTSALGEYSDFAKGNVEAIVESGKILAAGVKDMSEVLVADGKSAFETLTADAKELAAVKSPADFFKLQSDLLRRNFDAAVAYGSKQSEAMLKLASDSVAPLSSRVSIAVDKVKKAA